MVRVIAWVFLLSLVHAASLMADPGEVSSLPPAAEGPVRFAEDVEPLFRRHCYACHGPERQESGLRLDSKAKAMAGGDHGPAIVAGKSAHSRLILVAAGLDTEIGAMPPNEEGATATGWTAKQIGVVRAWIDRGAEWPDRSPAELAASHWSFKPIVRSIPPEPKRKDWLRTPVDAFVAVMLDEQGIEPAADASPATWLRRVQLDLVGLLPDQDLAADFLEFSQPDRRERALDRILASPGCGERWGRHWLDLARYADSDGYEKDKPRPYASHYRDWVIGAINADLPFDEFSTDQLAGDLRTPPSDARRIAAGFHRNTLHNTEGGADPEEDRVKKTVDRTNTFGTVWLGLTVGCAQCHSHKYDPITQREYYSLYAFFDSLSEQEFDFRGAGVSDTEKAATVAEGDTPRVTHVHLRGDFLSLGEQVQRGTFAVLPAPQSHDGRGDRLTMANWLFHPSHPLTSRVAVNRIWGRLFGRGLVTTADDFGRQGERPSHPALLDWLAAEFRDSGWQAKRFQRKVMLSAAYAQSSKPRPELANLDPENKWLARQARMRVEAEIIRDLALDAGGLLVRRVGGPSVRPPQPGEYASLTYANSASWKTSDGANAYRRGLYTFFQRTSPYPMLMTFDAPDSNECCVQRSTSNTPLQALTLWNDPVFFEAAQGLARRIATVPTQEVENRFADRDRIRFAMRLCLTREAEANEIEALQSLRAWADEQALVRSPDGSRAERGGNRDAPAEAWLQVARVLLNLDEFIMRE